MSLSLLQIARPPLTIFAIVVLAGCHGRPSPVSAPAAPVTVAQPVQLPITDYHDYTGRIEAVETVELRARVQGYLEQIHFKEGSTVKKGDILFEIDPRTFEADFEKARADVSRAEAQVKVAITELERSGRLRKTLSVTEEEYQQRVAARDTAKAALRQAEAAVEGARLQLSFTKIEAPIDGRISRTLVTEGNLVGAGQPTLLTTIVRTDPVYVYFDVPEFSFLEYQRLIREQGAPTASEGKVPIYVGLANQKGYLRRGIVDFRDNRVDPSTGTIQIRGELPNSDGVLTPGLFARVRVPIGKPVERLLVPQVAVSTDQRGQYLLVLRENNTVAYRSVQIGSTRDDLVVVLNGIKLEDWVLINGLQRARPGATVAPQRTVIDKAPSPSRDSSSQESTSARRDDNKGRLLSGERP